MSYFIKAILLSITLSILSFPLVYNHGILLAYVVMFILFCISFLVLGFFGFIIDNEIETQEFWERYENSKKKLVLTKMNNLWKATPATKRWWFESISSSPNFYYDMNKRVSPMRNCRRWERIGFEVRWVSLMVHILDLSLRSLLRCTTKYREISSGTIKIGNNACIDNYNRKTLFQMTVYK